MNTHSTTYFKEKKQFIYQRWSPWERPWPRGHILKSLALALKPQVLGLGLEALGPRKLLCPRLENSTFLNRWNFVGKRQKPRRKFANTFFVFRNGNIGLAKRAPPPIEISPMTKMWQKSLLFLQFQYLFSIFRLQLKTRGPGTLSNQFLPANLNVNLEEMDSFRSKSCTLLLYSSCFVFSFFFVLSSFCFLVFFYVSSCSSKKKLFLLLWLSRVAADSKTSRSLRRHSGAAFFINNNTIRSRW